MIGAGHVARMGEIRNIYKMLVGNLKGRDRHKRKHNIKMDLKKK
jgi:hypothetical protein